MVSGFAGTTWPNAAKRPLVWPTLAPRYYVPGWCVVNRTPWDMTADRIRYFPIWVEETVIFTRIGIEVTIGAAGTCDLRIFKWAAGLPGALILSAGTVDTTVAGVKTIVIAQRLDRGFYFVAYRHTAACTVYGPLDDAWCNPVQGYGVAGFPEHELSTLYDDAAYADPAAAPDGIDYSIYACAFLGVA